VIARKPVVVLALLVSFVFGSIVVANPAGATINSAVIVPSPNVGSSASQLVAVDCVSESWCVAVGTATVSTASRALIEVWDGAAWKTVP